MLEISLWAETVNSNELQTAKRKRKRSANTHIKETNENVIDEQCMSFNKKKKRWISPRNSITLIKQILHWLLSISTVSADSPPFNGSVIWKNHATESNFQSNSIIKTDSAILKKNTFSNEKKKFFKSVKSSINFFRGRGKHDLWFWLSIINVLFWRCFLNIRNRFILKLLLNLQNFLFLWIIKLKFTRWWDKKSWGKFFF